ncbi:MAG: GNAT family N-acetyltransferase [Gemmataceae bacterium]|jgi:glucosamine-phosphate N-acetyltransferase|nr:GNAT family N-acetyltransferase [Gemmataceae bacterium]
MDWKIRELIEADLTKGFIETLESLTDVGLTPQEAIPIFRQRKASGVLTLVAVNSQDQIIGTASLIIEQKFIHRGGRIGHIEDVAVHPQAQGKGIGAALIQTLINAARTMKCYKVILGCNDKNIPFYEKQGFHKHENGMRLDLPLLVEGGGEGESSQEMGALAVTI